MVFAGGHFYRSAWKSLLNGAATMDTLVALGTGVAWLYSMSVNPVRSGSRWKRDIFITKPAR